MFRKTLVLFIIMLVLLLLISVFGGSLRTVSPGMPVFPPLEMFEDDAPASSSEAAMGAEAAAPAFEDEEDAAMMGAASAEPAVAKDDGAAAGDVEAFEPATSEGGFAAF